MTLVADLYTERGVWRTDRAYVFASNDLLTVNFGAEHAGESVYARSAHHARPLRLDKNGEAQIPEELLEAGTLLFSVERYVDGKLLAEWKVDPLTVLHEDKNISMTPWSVHVEHRLADLENAVFGQSSPLFE